MGIIALPIVLINVGQQAMGVADTLMVGRLGGQAIASVALGNFYFFNISIFGIGMLFALDPIIAQAVGAGDTHGVSVGLQRGIVLAAITAVLIMLALVPGEWILSALDQPREVIAPTAEYARRRALGVLPFLLFNVFRQTLQAMGPVRPILIAVVVANVVNVIANWMLIYGHLGAPALGVPGSGYATALAMWTMFATLFVLSRPTLLPALRPWHDSSTRFLPLLQLARIGAPIGGQWFFESFAFGLTALLMGWLGTASLAGHEIALNMAALTFMVPLGVGGAAAAVVGRAIGRGDMAAARRDALASVVCGVGFMCLSAAIFIAAPEFLASLYTREPATFAIAIALIPLAGAFQIFDGLQAVTSGILRGTGDTRVPAILHIVAFWGVGIPLGAYLGLRTPYRERGLWYGLVVGLAAASLLQSARATWRLRTEVARLAIER